MMVYLARTSVSLYTVIMCLSLTLRLLRCDEWGVWNAICCTDTPITRFHVISEHITLIALSLFSSRALPLP